MAKKKNKAWVNVHIVTTFGFKDRIRILFGKKHEVHTTVEVEFNSKELNAISTKTNWSFVHKLFPKKHQGLLELIDSELRNYCGGVRYWWSPLGKFKSHSERLFRMIEEGEYEGKPFEVYEEVKKSDYPWFG